MMTMTNQTGNGVQSLMQNSIFSARNITRIGTWNVRTLFRFGQLTQLLQEFDIYKLDVLGISEMRWTGSNHMVSDGKVVIYTGHEDKHERNVGLILGKRAAAAMIG